MTVRNILQQDHVYETARARTNRMAEFEAHNLALPGDVIVIDGVAGFSNMGGIRDVGDFRRVDYPLRATEVTPVTGKWRIETAEINDDIQIAGIWVSPGDVAIARETGVCFVPISRAKEVLAIVSKKAAAEDAKCAAIDAGTPVTTLPGNA